MVLTIRNGRAGHVRIIALAVFFLVYSLSVFGQQPTCSITAGSPTVHAEGLAELVGDITISCSGGGPTVTTILAISLNANITNRLDASGNLTGITYTSGGVAVSPPTFNAPSSLFFGSLQISGVGAPFVISGLRVAVPTVTGGSAAPLITATIQGTQVSLPDQASIVGVAAPTLLASVLNYGVPCLGSPLPASVTFQNLAGGGSSSSTVRITEASNGAFAPKSAGSDFGVRFVVNISGYGTTAQVYVPDAIVGNRGTTPTSSGAFGSSVNAGTYTPGQNQLLLARVNGADANGLGGTLAVTTPGAVSSFTSVTQLTLVNGAASVTYEVLDANPNALDSAQIPVFVTTPASSCTTQLANTLSVALAPVSKASVPTQADPIPRYVAGTPASDCNVFQDCTNTYFPVLQAAPTSITLNGSSLGQPQTAFITLTDGGTTQFSFTATTTYQTPANLSTANWLSINGSTGTTVTGVVNPGSGVTSVGLSLSASPAALTVPGTYQATVTINAGSAGTQAIPVVFTVAAAGPVIQSVVNAANSQPGPITAGSFAAIYGLNLVPKTATRATVTVNGLPATISYDGQPSASAPTQINILVPEALAGTATVAVTATVDGVASNNFPVTLVANAPAVFNPGILNQNNSVNLVAAPASLGDIIQIFLTGLATPIGVPVTVNIGSQSITSSQIIYQGPSTIAGLEQINVQVPSALQFTGNSAPLTICVPGANGQTSCSAPVNLYLH